MLSVGEALRRLRSGHNRQERGMSEPRLQSLRLEGQPRRDQFRAARQALQAACGSHTIAGDLRLLSPDEALHAPTVAPGGSNGRFMFYLKDGNEVLPLHFG